MLSKRNTRIASITALLLLIVFFVYTNTHTTFAAQPSAEENTDSINRIKQEINPALVVSDSGSNIGVAASSTGTNSGNGGAAISNKGALFDPKTELATILGMGPVVVFSKTTCPYSQSLKQLLSKTYTITPAPIIIELDKHANGPELQAYLKEVSGRGTVPNLFVGGLSRGGCDETTKLHDEGVLDEKLKAWAGKSLMVERHGAPSNQ